MSYQDYGFQSAQSGAVPWSVVDALIQAESGWSPDTGYNAAGASSAYGMGQFLVGPSGSPSSPAPGTLAYSEGVNPSDPYSSIDGVVNSLGDAYDRTGSWAKAVLSYYPKAATDPNYAPVWQAANAADASGWSNETAPSGSGAVYTPPTGSPASMTNTQNQMNQMFENLFPGTGGTPGGIAQGAANAIGGKVWIWITGALVILLGIGLITVGGLGLAFRTSRPQGGSTLSGADDAAIASTPNPARVL